MYICELFFHASNANNMYKKLKIRLEKCMKQNGYDALFAYVCTFYTYVYYKQYKMLLKIKRSFNLNRI